MQMVLLMLSQKTIYLNFTGTRKSYTSEGMQLNNKLYNYFCT